MKKLMSILLVIAVVATMAFSMVASAEVTKTSLLPASADAFEAVEGGEGTVTVTADGEGYKFVADKGWPCAVYHNPDVDTHISTNINDETAYIEYDINVVSGGASVLIFFCGQNPQEFAASGNFVALNANMMNDESYFNELAGTATDVPAGHYTGKLYIKDIWVNPGICLDDGTFTISGAKIFAVGGEVDVNYIRLVTGDEGAAGGNTDDNNTGDTGSTPNPGTGDNTHAITFAVVALAAAGVVTLSVVAKKAKSR